MPAAKIIVRKSAFDARATDPSRLVLNVVEFVAAILQDDAVSKRRTPRRALDVSNADHYLLVATDGGHSRFIFDTKLTAQKTWRSIERALESMEAIRHLRVFRAMLQWTNEHPGEANAQTGLPGGRADALDDLDAALFAIEEDDKMRRRAARWIAGWTNLTVVEDERYDAAVRDFIAAAAAQSPLKTTPRRSWAPPLRAERSDLVERSIVAAARRGGARYEWPEIRCALPFSNDGKSSIADIARWLHNPVYLALEDLRAQAPHSSAPRETRGAHLAEDRSWPEPTYVLRLSSGAYFATFGGGFWLLRACRFRAVNRVGARRPKDGAPWARAQDIEAAPGAVLAATSMARAERLAQFAVESRAAAAIHHLAQRFGAVQIDSVAPMSFEERRSERTSARWMVAMRDPADSAAQMRLVDIDMTEARISVDLVQDPARWKSVSDYEATADRGEIETHWRALLRPLTAA